MKVIMIKVISLALLSWFVAHPSRVVVLDWSFGDSVLCPTATKPLNLGLFNVTGGGTLADRKAEFKEAVRTKIEAILYDAVGVRVKNAPSNAKAETTVRLSQELSPTKKNEIGLAHYDPKNKYHDDEAIIFGEQILRLGDDRPFEDWVMIFSNVCSHETLHTFGYKHVSRDECPPDGLSIELMLDGHTIDEMRREQRVLTKIDGGVMP